MDEEAERAGGGASAPRRSRRSRCEVRRRRSTARARSAPALSWPMNVTRPSGSSPRVCGLRGVVQQRGQAHRRRRGQLVRERLGEHAPRSSSAVVAALAARRRRRAPRACGRRRRGGGSRSAPPRAAPSARAARRRAAPTLVHQREAARAPRSEVTTRLSSANTRSGATCVDRRARARDRGAGRRVERQVELDDEPDRAQGAQRVLGQRGRRRPSARRRPVEVGAAAVRVEQLAAGQRLGHRVDREVARPRGRRRCRRRAASTRSTCQRVVAGRRPATPRTRRRAGTRSPPAARAIAAGGAPRLAAHREVDVVGRRARAAGRAPRRRPATRSARPSASPRPRAVASAALSRPVLARHARADPAGDLVVDRAERARRGPRRGSARRRGRRSAPPRCRARPARRRGRR